MADIDPVDYGILYLLGNDARNRTTTEIGDALGLAPSTIGTRINDLEAEGIIRGYEPRIDYDKLGFEHQFIIAGTAPFEHRQTIAGKLAEIRAVVNVRSMMTTEINVAVKIVGSSRTSIEHSLEELQDRDLSINRIEILETEHHQPVNIFGDFVSNDMRFV
jgi:DNA-binding Lrp family transcriptional regulator